MSDFDIKITKENRKWLDNLGLNHPLLIAGPCSAETEEQVFNIAQDLKEMNVSYFRAGIWKPRTRPGMFEGVGALGLKWLEKVKKELGLKIATEIANRDHIKLALQYDVDMLWIGARSTVSPFIIQEIADALEGTDKIILVKNPISPDLGLWIGALERLQRANVKNLGVIHRGFSTYEKTKYRNIFNGLMIETHCSPDNAWSDASQQITPKRLNEIINTLSVRRETTNEVEFQTTLQQLRAQIDILDEQLLEILKKRMEASDRIGKLKHNANVAILQNKRWNELLSKMLQLGKLKGFSKEFIDKLFKTIHQESINRQESIFRE